MKREPQEVMIQSTDSARWPRGRRFVPFIAFAFLALPSRAHASFLHGETLDTVADVIAWFAFIIVPPVLIVAFLAVHIFSLLSSADYSGRLHGSGPTRNQFSTRWPTAQMSIARTKNPSEKNPPSKNSNNSARVPRNSKRRLKEGRRNGNHPAWHLRLLRLAHFL